MAKFEDFTDYQDEMKRHFLNLRVSDSALVADPVTKPNERLAQCIWFDSLLLHDNLKTDSGKSLEIRQPGRWNSEEGPDFREARLVIDGEDVTGDVEIHLNSSGWRQHRHHLNSAYDNVILHAYLWHEETPRETRDSKGRFIESFCMEPCLFPDLDSIRNTVNIEDYPYSSSASYGKCQPLMTTLDEDFVAGMLEAAGRERLKIKAGRFANQAEGTLLDQVFYQAVMTYMGHGSNKSLFFLLSKRAPLIEMADYLGDLGRECAVPFFQSILFHVARMIPESDEEMDKTDDETREYIALLRKYWKNYAGYFSDRLIPKTRQWISGVRPVNFATRRLAGVSYLLDNCFLDEGFASFFTRVFMSHNMDATLRRKRQWIKKELIGLFVVDEADDYWTWRYTFTAKRARKPMKLIGENRAACIVFNALLPLMLYHAHKSRDNELEDRVWDVYRSFPALESNSIVRHMQHRLFGEDPRGKRLMTSEIRQQGLFHIFAECCQLNEKGCEDCYYSQG